MPIDFPMQREVRHAVRAVEPISGASHPRCRRTSTAYVRPLLRKVDGSGPRCSQDFRRAPQPSAIARCWATAFLCGFARRQASIRRILVDGCRKLSRKSGKKLFLRQPRLLYQRRQDILPDRLLNLRRRNLLVGTRADPGFSGISLPVLRELLMQLIETAAEQASDAACA